MRFKKEQEYVIDCLLGYALNDMTVLSVSLEKDRYRLFFFDKIVEIKNAFFACIDGDDYVKKEYLPQKAEWLHTPFEGLEKVPVIYGEDELKVEGCYVYCGLDIFASAFFMLTRWEELLLPKDRHGRCDESEMFVVRHGIAHRPIVNEYIELLRALLEAVGIAEPEPERRFHPFITHDVDDLFRYASMKNFCKNLAGDLLHRKSIPSFFRTLRNYFSYRCGEIRDPFDTFDELMDWSEAYGWKDAFYFMPSCSGEFDARYDIRDRWVVQIVRHIVERGHEVGIHPSKNTFHDAGQFAEEVRRLRSLYGGMKGGRQHYLLYDLPGTLNFWERAKLEYDSGLGFAFRGGFRCGICYPYPYFDVLRREKLNLTVRPLVVMEAALLRGMTPDEMKGQVMKLIDTVARYRGEFVFLWHTDNLHRQSASGYAELYKELLDYIAQKEKDA